MSGFSRVEGKAEEALRELERLARDAHAESIGEEARALAERAAEGRFYVTCVGQFKRGKSTLLNALVETAILPTGVVPVTSVPTILRYGDLQARLRRAGGAWEEVDPNDLAEYVSEERNPGNRKGVLALEAFVPSRLLSTGLCFVDTPGIGSVFEANTATTREFIPHIDAALVVLGADPPISGEELRLVEEISQEVKTLLFVLNKADRVTEGERTEAKAFARRILSERLGRPLDDLYEVSALHQLSDSQDAWDWVAFVGRLRTLADESGRALVTSALQRGLRRLADRLQQVIRAEMDALRRPLAESEQRLAALRIATGQVEVALRDVGPLLDAEQRRLKRMFADRRQTFLKEVYPVAGAGLRKAIRPAQGSGPALRQRAYEVAAEIAKSKVLPWLAESERAADEAYRQAVGRFTGIAKTALTGLRESDPFPCVTVSPHLGQDEWLDAPRRFHFHEFIHLASPAGLVPVFRWLADLLLPRRLVLRQIERDTGDFLAHLLEANTSRVENDLCERLRESRRRLEAEIGYALSDGLKRAERAIERARMAQAEGELAVQAEIERLEALEARLAVLDAGIDVQSVAEDTFSLEPRTGE